MKASLWLCFAASSLTACGSPAPPGEDLGDGGSTPDVAPVCVSRCSEDLRQILDCDGKVMETCSGTDACDARSGVCTNACTAADADRRSIGCDYYAVHMDTYQPKYCFAVFVANTWNAPAKLAVTYDGSALPIESFTRLPVGSGPDLSYAPYSAATGIPPGEVAVLFLGGESGPAPRCPAPTAVPTANKIGTTLASAFHITSDVPVVAYQISPFGGGSAAVTAASLLLPSSVWDTNYVAVNVSPTTVGAGNPSLNIIAREDGTIATITPVTSITGGGGIPPAVAGQHLQLILRKGQHAQITQPAELTGSVVSANKPIGFMAGQTCMTMPNGQLYCDHGEQMIPPTRALGHSYVGVMYRPRVVNETGTYFRVVGTVDGTELTYSTDVGGPATLRKGQSVTFETGQPFVVSSQDKDHPFMLFAYMTGSGYVAEGYGDPDFVLMVPPRQYLRQYVFFTDPTYPETNLVLVRARGVDQQFHDVTLDCFGAVSGWQPVGDYEYARVDLVTGNFAPVGNCSTGRREIRSDAPFGLSVWGWGTPLTGAFTQNVSYGYPGGMNVAPINDIIIN
jgi:IgGFc binding protein